MSRVGKKPVALPKGVKVSVAGAAVSVQGPKGTLTIEHRPEVSVVVESGPDRVEVTRADDSRAARAYHGMTRALIQNMVTGVTEGFTKELEINGVGWGARMQGRSLALTLGYADTRLVEVPMGVDVAINGTRVTVTGIDKQAVGQFAARVRSQRKPEPYNGKGVKYIDEQIIRKEGKAFASGG